MKIAIDARIIKSSTGRYIERLVNYLEKIDTTNEYIILVREKDARYYKPQNPNFSVVVAEFADYSFAEQLGFAKFLYKLKVDLVHFCMPQQPLLYRKASITTVHDLNLLRITANDDMGQLELKVKKQIFGWLLKRVVKKSRHIITPSKYTKYDLIDYTKVSAKKITVTYEGADPATSKPEPVAILKNEQFLLYVGRAEPYKNNRGLIKAHQELLKTNPELKLVIVGKKDVLRQADITWVKQNKYKNIEFLGFVSDEALAWLYGHCVCYVVSSWMEGFGLPGLEAMSYGAPVASSNTTCMPEVYGNAAEYFNPHSPDDMARAIKVIMTRKGRREQLIANGKKVHAKYSWEKMAKQTQQIYKKVLEQK